MSAKAVHTAVEALLGRAASWSSIRNALADNAIGSWSRFVRVAKGHLSATRGGVDTGERLRSTVRFVGLDSLYKNETWLLKRQPGSLCSAASRQSRPLCWRP